VPVATSNVPSNDRRHHPLYQKSLRHIERIPSLLINTFMSASFLSHKRNFGCCQPRLPLSQWHEALRWAECNASNTHPISERRFSTQSGIRCTDGRVTTLPWANGVSKQILSARGSEVGSRGDNLSCLTYQLPQPQRAVSRKSCKAPSQRTGIAGLGAPLPKQSRKGLQALSRDMATDVNCQRWM
jgi:hypothetical protein